MNGVCEAIEAVRGLVLRDDALTLKYASVWLRTDIFDGEHEWEEQPIEEALGIAARNWPEIACEALRLMWRGVDMWDLEYFLLLRINTQLVEPLRALEMVERGVPVRSYAVGHNEMDDRYWPEEFLGLGLPFGMWEIDGEPTQGDFNAAHRVRDSLTKYPEASEGEAIFCLVAWAFGISENTAIDYHEEAIEEMKGYSGCGEWLQENIDLVNEMNAQARRIYLLAQHGLRLLARADWNAAMKRNIKIAKQGKKHGRNQQAIRWPDAAERLIAGAAGIETGYIPRECDFDETNDYWI